MCLSMIGVMEKIREFFHYTVFVQEFDAPYFCQL
jgi:hypothetical protein